MLNRRLPISVKENFSAGLIAFLLCAVIVSGLPAKPLADAISPGKQYVFDDSIGDRGIMEIFFPPEP